MCVAFWSAFPVSIFQPRSLVAQSTWKRGKRSSQKFALRVGWIKKQYVIQVKFEHQKNAFFKFFFSISLLEERLEGEMLTKRVLVPRQSGAKLESSLR